VRFFIALAIDVRGIQKSRLSWAPRWTLERSRAVVLGIAISGKAAEGGPEAPRRFQRRSDQTAPAPKPTSQITCAAMQAVEAAALRLHSFYTGVERMLLLVGRVVKGGTPSTEEAWYGRRLERMAMPTNGTHTTRFAGVPALRHLVRNLYAAELRSEPIQHLDEQLQQTWRMLATDITGFQSWLTTIAAH